MNNTTIQRPTRIFLGVPQTDKIQVYKVAQGRQVLLRRAVLTNTATEDAALTLTVNTIDILKDFVVPAGETKTLELYIVLYEGDTVNLQQGTENAINVALNGNYC